MKRLSIVIVTHESEDHIFDCVESILKYSYLSRNEVELIIVDNCSQDVDNMFSLLRQVWGDGIVLVKNSTNGGYGQGNNLGIQHATAPIVLIMNPDVRLCEPIFQRALEHFEKNKHIGMLGMTQMKSTTQRSNHSFYPTWLVNGYLRYVLYLVCNRLNLYLPSCMAIQGSCFFLRRDMFQQVGGFDDTHFMYGEEDDLYYRMKGAFGTKCFAFDKRLHYIHLHNDHTPSLNYEKRLFEANISLYSKKGVDKALILRHFLQANRILLLKENMMGRGTERYKVLKQFREYLLLRLPEFG